MIVVISSNNIVSLTSIAANLNRACRLSYTSAEASPLDRNSLLSLGSGRGVGANGEGRFVIGSANEPPLWWEKHGMLASALGNLDRNDTG